MTKKTRTFLLNTALLLLVAGAGYAATIHFNNGNAPISATPPKAEPVTAFAFTALDGKTRSLSDFKDKIVIINFWATWCPPCIKEFPSLLKIAQQNRDDVVLIALSSDMDEEVIKNFLKKQTMPGNNVFIALDQGDITYKIFGIKQLPETIITDRALNQHQKLIGAEWTEKQLQQIIDSLSK